MTKSSGASQGSHFCLFETFFFQFLWRHAPMSMVVDTHMENKATSTNVGRTIQIRMTCQDMDWHTIYVCSYICNPTYPQDSEHWCKNEVENTLRHEECVQGTHKRSADSSTEAWVVADGALEVHWLTFARNMLLMHNLFSKTSWGHCLLCLGMFWACFGYASDMCWTCLRHILDMFRTWCGHVLAMI